MRLSVASILGPYKISTLIGAGGMGEVYGAVDTRLGREVAIKVLPHELSQDAERLARFEREARSASALNHPNIVTVHEFASQAGETYLVMELVRGESLRDLILRGPIPIRKLLAIATGIAEGLGAAHTAGIVHRDIKPENVMVTPEGTAKILDFGLVKGSIRPATVGIGSTHLEVSRAGTILGTASYMSPEHARGEEVDFRSDQFSLGIVLHEAATGQHPFRGTTTFETVAAIINKDPEPLGAGFPEPFTWVIDRCLAKDPRERYGSTVDLARDLARLRDRVHSGPTRPLHVGEKARPARWLVPGGVAAVVIALVAFAALGQRTESPVDPPMQFAVATPEIPEVHFGEVAHPVVISPDGRYVAVYGRAADATDNIWLNDLRAGTTRLFAERAFGPAWSPDSREVAYFAEGRLKAAAVEGGPPRIVCDARPEGTPSWSGNTILFTQYSREPGLYRVSAAGGVPERILQPNAEHGPAWSPEFLPDGKRFLFVAMNLRAPGVISHELRLGSLDRAATQSITTISSRAVYNSGRLLFVRDGTLVAQAFDLETLRLTGEARPLLDDVHYMHSTGLAAFSVSQDGLLAWRSARRAGRFVWLDRSGMELATVGSGRVDASGRLSPEGKHYAIGIVDPKYGVSDIWVYDLARQSRERVTSKLLDEKNPVWGRDGTIFYRSDGGGGPPDIFRLIPGRDGADIPYRGPGVDEPHDVSPDGRSLLFVDYNQVSGADIQILPLAPAGPPRAFAATPFQELSPRFSPDGARVAYSSDVSGRPEIYVRGFESTSPAVLVSRSGGTRPRWSPDGKDLLFLGPDGRVMAAGVSAGFAAPRMLFQATDILDFEVHPDGTRFLAQLVDQSNDPPVHVLVNWTGRLSR